MVDYEQMGVFYLGKKYDVDKRVCLPKDFLLYESRDLLTHAVCLGMTGSGKTGLAIDLLEEAAIDGVPVIAVDPKGDLSNLLLTFPNLDAASFLPYTDPDQARRAGISAGELAGQEAERWRIGLSDWQQDASRIELLRKSADFAVYTPASSAGIPISPLSSFAAPGEEVLEERDLMRELVSGTATSILALLGLEADPLKSKEHILVSAILDRSWRAGESLDLSGLIAKIQNPPLKQLGAIPLESFFPGKERYEFAMSLNNLLAAPGFEAWLEGEPLDIDRLFWAENGKNKVSIISISHLSDGERMFFVSLLLSKLLSWMRRQSGTSSLRALFYMDEILGYFPPVKNPPAKEPLITLLKQARAFGLGLVLATQNPVDLDYKALANTGTWFIGRMQTERDKLRVLDGLESASSESGRGFDRKYMDKLISSLEKQVFLMNNVHQAEPLVFKSRWSLSYLRGPLSRAQLKSLKQQPDAGPASKVDKKEEASLKAFDLKPADRAEESTFGAQKRPLVGPKVLERFARIGRETAEGAALVYKPMLFASFTIRFLESKYSIDILQSMNLMTLIKDETLAVKWERAFATKFGIDDLLEAPDSSLQFSLLPSSAADEQNYKVWTKDLEQWLLENKKLQLYRCPLSSEISKPDESERDFRIRLHLSSREKRDKLLSDLTKKYSDKMRSLEDKLSRAKSDLDREIAESKQMEMSAVIDVGASIFQAMVGRKIISSTNIGRATSAARQASRIGRQRQDLEHAQATVDKFQERFDELEREFQQELAALKTKLDPESQELGNINLSLKKSNINISRVLLCWAPCVRQADGKIMACW